MEEKKKKDSIWWNFGSLLSSFVGLMIFMTIFGFIMYCMDNCVGKIL